MSRGEWVLVEKPNTSSQTAPPTRIVPSHPIPLARNPNRNRPSTAQATTQPKGESRNPYRIGLGLYSPEDEAFFGELGPLRYGLQMGDTDQRDDGGIKKATKVSWKDVKRISSRVSRRLSPHFPKKPVVPARPVSIASIASSGFFEPYMQERLRQLENQKCDDPLSIDEYERVGSWILDWEKDNKRAFNCDMSHCRLHVAGERYSYFAALRDRLHSRYAQELGYEVIAIPSYETANAKSDDQEHAIDAHQSPGRDEMTFDDFLKGLFVDSTVSSLITDSGNIARSARSAHTRSAFALD